MLLENTSSDKRQTLSREEAERLWRIHGNEILASDPEYLAADREQHRVGKIVGWAYAILITGLLLFMIGFYLWRFRFFWAIVIYVVLLTICAFAGRTISVHAVRNDHLGELVRDAHDRYISSLTSR